MTIIMADRSIHDIDVQPVRLMPSRRDPISIGLLSCSACGVMPTDNDGHLLLEMVSVPDRVGTQSEHVFLGPVCKEREVKRYLMGIAPQ